MERGGVGDRDRTAAVSGCVSVPVNVSRRNSPPAQAEARRLVLAERAVVDRLAGEYAARAIEAVGERDELRRPSRC